MAKFKVGERVRYLGTRATWSGPMAYAGKEGRIEYSLGECCWAKKNREQKYGVRFADGCRIAVYEESLRKLLPDSDTYRPASISIDNLMNTVRKPVEVSE